MRDLRGVGRRWFGGCLVCWVAVAVFAPSLTFAAAGKRVFELVTPPVKNGASGFPVGANSREPVFEGVFPLVAAGDGERFLFGANAAFAGARFGSLDGYLAVRGVSGWRTVPVSPASEVPHPGGFGGGQPLVFDGNQSLSRVLFGTPYEEFYPGSVPDKQVLSSVLVGGVVSDVSDATGGATVEYAGMSGDGSRVVFATGARLLPDASEDGGLYERDLTTGTTRVVSVLPDGEAVAGAHVGSATHYVGVGSGGHRINLGESRGAVSADGSRVVFTYPAGTSTPHGLYLRVGAQESKGEGRTLEVSASAFAGGVAAVVGARFQWMTPDGAHVFFEDDGQLSEEASATGAALYRYDVNEAGTGGALTVISAGLPGAMGLVGASADGQVAYFLSEGVLAGSEAVRGEPNLYVNDEGVVSFIATLSTSDEVLLARRKRVEGAVKEEVEPTVEARVTPDGRHLVFQSRAPLTGFVNAGHPEIYEYALGSSGVVCVSCGRVEPAVRDAELSYRPATPWLEPPLNLTPDGEWVFFESDEALVPQATAGVWSVYQYHEGVVSLVSSATAVGNSRFLGASESGRDVFFTSFGKLVPEDVDTAGDIYDARIGGGFAKPVAAMGCDNGECQGPVAPLAAPSAPASVTQPAGENVVARKAKQPGKKGRKGKRKHKGKATRRHAHRAGKHRSHKRKGRGKHKHRRHHRGKAAGSGRVHRGAWTRSGRRRGAR